MIVATFQTITALAERQKRRAQMGVRLMREAALSMLRDSVQDAHRLSSGGIKTKDLRRMGHPYGRRAATERQRVKGTWGRQRAIKGTRERLPPLPINVQTGRLKQSIRTAVTETQRGAGERVVLWRVVYDEGLAPYGKFIARPGGTRTMVARPIRRATTDLAIRRKIRLKEAKRAAERS